VTAAGRAPEATGAMASASPAPLEGIRVLDFTHAAAGPFTTMFLADMGAEVIKLERPRYGDGARSMGNPMPGFGRHNSDYYLSLNRNKKDVVIDVSREAGAQLALNLARRCDVVVQNFRPGVMDRLGVGFEAVRQIRPDVVYCSISAFGHDGPWSARPANDIIMQSVSGLMGITGEADGGPVRIGAPVADYTTGLFALSGILAALLVRDAHPEGQHIQISMLEASLNLMCNYIPAVAGLGAHIPRLGRAHAQIVPYQAFECADGEYLMVGAFTRVFWQNFARALDHEEWISDERFSTNSARLRNRDALVVQLDAIFATRTRTDWLALLDTADVPCSPVLELHDVVESEPVVAAASIETLRAGDREARVVRSPIRVEQWGAPEPAMAPDLGADTESVLRELLALPEAQIEALSADGIIESASTDGSGK
jgi:crotonobetainyl-CoA:carnitine CoA-transferase CaiB-like acyl-CoA transferase